MSKSEHVIKIPQNIDPPVKKKPKSLNGGRNLEFLCGFLVVILCGTAIFWMLHEKKIINLNSAQKDVEMNIKKFNPNEIVDILKKFAVLMTPVKPRNISSKYSETKLDNLIRDDIDFETIKRLNFSFVSDTDELSNKLKSFDLQPVLANGNGKLESDIHEKDIQSKLKSKIAALQAFYDLRFIKVTDEARDDKMEIKHDKNETQTIADDENSLTTTTEAT